MKSFIPLFAASFLSAGAAYANFNFEKSEDTFTDEDRSFIITYDEGGNGALAWKCMSDGLNVLYLHGTYFGGDSDNRIMVQYRVDDNDPSGRSSWGLMQGKETSYMPMSKIPYFTEEAKGGTYVNFEAIDPLDGERVTHKFSLTGLAAGLEKLSCY